MLKKIQFTFTVDPKDLALLLAHAGKLDVSLLADQPATRAQLALPKPPKPVELILAFAQGQKQFTQAQAIEASKLSRVRCENAINYLVHIKKLKRIERGVYARA